MQLGQTSPMKLPHLLGATLALGAGAIAAPLPSLPLAEKIHVNGIAIDPRSPPAGLVLREALGLLTVPALNGQIVHRTTTRILETRAVLTPRGDYLLLFPEGEHYATANGRPKANTMIAYRSSDRGRTWRGPSVAFDIDYSQHGFVPLIPRGTTRL